ncbi:hypothetical protein ACIQWB_37220 [Streptomyces olivaceus]|uniref:hypothetical protein n=1 Tax=Streptomyces olivaceus TaxID=47716 RepID=UPI003819F719
MRSVGGGVLRPRGPTHHPRPRRAPHHFRNASATAPLPILWIYGSVDATRTLVETGVTTRVDAEHDKRVRARVPGRAPEDGRRPGRRPG